MFTSKIKLVTFDATDTLLKFSTPPWEYYARIASNHGYKVCSNEIKKQFVSSYKRFTKDHPNFGRESIQWENWWKNVVCGALDGQIKDSKVKSSIAVNLIEEFKTAKCWKVATGTKELIKYFKEHRIYLGVISNFDPRLHDILCNMHLYSYFNFILTSYDAGYSKPDRRIFESAIKRSALDVSPKECLHIGDDVEKDFEGARAAGWQAVLVTEKQHSLTKEYQRFIFKNFNELNEKIKYEKIFQ